MNICKLQQTFTKRICLAAFLITFSACASNVPAPSTDPQEPQGKQGSEAVSVKDKTEATAVENTATVPEEKFEADTTKADTLSAEIIQQANPGMDSVLAEKEHPVQNRVVDPYTVFPALVDSIFAHADSLYKLGHVDSATAYLERFRVIKPLWNNWENQADSLLQEFAKTQAERAKQFEPIVLQIVNMNRVQTAYSIVAETADSLIAQAPGDSLVLFAKEQKSIAYSNTLAKAQKEQEQIWKLAQEQAQFAEAEKQAVNLQMRFRDFEDTLHIQAMIDSIHNQGETINTELAKYWEENDAGKAMAEVDLYLAKEQFEQAKELLVKLKASKLRKEAIDKYVLLADSFCNAQRKLTSSSFSKAQKQKESQKKKELLEEAISFLNKCLAEYPETSQKKKVEENRAFLEKELRR